MKKPVITLYALILKDLRAAQKAHEALMERAEALDFGFEQGRLQEQAQAAQKRADYASMVIVGLQGLGYLDEERP